MPNRNCVIVVDDDPGILSGVQSLLRQHAYEPILFSSAQAFKSHTDFEKVVCVILDINLNDGSGIELRHRLKADGVSVPVIYITGNADPAVRKAALASGCIVFLTKPFSAQSLIEPLKKASTGRSPDFIFQANIAHYKELLATKIDARETATIRKLLAEEEAKLANWHDQNPKPKAAE